MADESQSKKRDRIAALERGLAAEVRGLAALVERVELLEHEILPRAVPDYDDAEEREPPDPFERTMPLGPS